jgi:hypothetical protein
MWWRLRLLLEGSAKRLLRGGTSGAAAPEIVLLHQAMLRLERRIEVLERGRPTAYTDLSPKIDIDER